MIVHMPGIYFGMPAEEYHKDPAMGSTDIRAAVKGPRKYWLRSYRNPNCARYQEEDVKPTILGTAIHVYLLEGQQAFYKKYVRRPDDQPDADTASKSALTKAAKKNLSDGQILLHADDWALIEDIKWLIPTHPDLSELFTGGMYEVSVFWEDERTGIMCKARFDILKPAGIGDIKSVANEGDLRFDKACKFHIKKYRYDLQAEHYLEGRRQLPRFFQEGKVWLLGQSQAAPAKHDAFLKRCLSVNKFAFELVFVSKSLPEVWALPFTPGNPMLKHARDQIDTALDGIDQTIQKYGDKEWGESWRLEEADMNEMPGGEFGWD